MKLIYCRVCGDFLRLRWEVRYCGCRTCWGYYHRNGLSAVINKEAVPIGFTNHTFKHAIDNQPDAGRGLEFTAFVIPKKCSTVEVIDG